VRVVLPDGPETSAAARAALREACRDSSVDLDDVLLCASELVTNALLHGLPPIELEVRAEADRVWVAVHDAGRGGVEPRRTVTVDTSAGRGLHIVDSLAARWGSSYEGGTNTIWFEIGAVS
jgi:anti-sigma regulatory factor (Ser/Thr protein kinase)